MNKAKRTGLGASVYLHEEPEQDNLVDESQPVQKSPKQAMIRRTYYMKKETDKILNELRGKALLQGVRVSAGELLDEAVKLLAEKRREEK